MMLKRTTMAALAGLILACGQVAAMPGSIPRDLSELSFETMFGEFPQETSQQGLRELKPLLFADHGLSREEGCLAAALYFEARGESREGQIAVAQVVANRVKAKAYPDTICEVVWQNAHMRNACQFSFTCDGQPDEPKDRVVWERMKRLAVTFLGDDTVGEKKRAARLVSSLDAKTRFATHYHADYVAPRWSKALRQAGRIGRHIFYISDRVRRSMPRRIGI